MTTQVIKSIGSAGGRDYPDIQSFFNAVPADLVAIDQQWVGELYNDGEVILSAKQLLNARTTDATRNVILRAASGHGVAGHASALTNALWYDATKGVAIKSGFTFDYLIEMQPAYSEVRGLQINAVQNDAGATIKLSGASAKLIGNILSTASGRDMAAWVTGAGSVVLNNVVVTSGVWRGGITFDYAGSGTAAGNTLYCTNPSSGQGGALTCEVSGPVFKDNAIFGFGTPIKNGNANTTNNATDQASIGFGSGNLTGLTFANEFQSATDLRVKSTSSLVNAGVAVSGLTTDILGQARSATTPTIGAFEYVAAGGGGTTALTSSAASTATATASLTTSIVLAAAAVAIATASASLNVGNTMSAAASAVSTATAALTTSITLAASASGTSTATATLGVAGGTLTTRVLKNNTGTPLVNVSGMTLNIYNPTTGVLVLRKTGLTTNGAGRVVLTDPALIAGTLYAYEPDLTGISMGRRLPVANAS
jgi:hypothetical protein